MIQFYRNNAMRLFLALFGIVVLARCTNPEPLERIPEYEYPLDSLADGKVFTYRERNTGKPLFVKRKRVIENGITYIDEETYNELISISAARIRINTRDAKYVACYEYSQQDTGLIKIPAQIKESKNLQDGKKYRGIHFVWTILHMDKYWQRSAMDEVFDRQDTVHVGGNAVDVLVFSVHRTYTTKNRYFPFTTMGESNSSGEMYYARGMGPVRFTNRDDSEEWFWTLESITPAE
jgi:hypothetical protein